MRLIRKVTFNTGKENTGEYNTGYQNSGDWNSGNRNRGNWNSGDNHTGFFNTIQKPPVLLFNKPCTKEINFPSWLYFNITEWIEYTEEEKSQNKKRRLIGGYLKTLYYKEAFKRAFEKASKEDIKKTIKLPNFDYDVFEKISGITKQDIKRKIK